MLNIRKIIYLVVFTGYSFCHAGSYDDFFAAVKRDDVDEVMSLLARGFDANTRSPAGEHPLFLAIREPSPKVAVALVGIPKIDVEPRNAQDESPLMLACLKGQLDVAMLLISKGADVNKPGWAPLHYASTHGHLDVMRLLLEHHAYIDASSPNGTTPLMMAAHYGTPSAVKLLLEAGADPMIRNDLGLTAVDFAFRAERKESAEIISAFIRGRQPKGAW